MKLLAVAGNMTASASRLCAVRKDTQDTAARILHTAVHLAFAMALIYFLSRVYLAWQIGIF